MLLSYSLCITALLGTLSFAEEISNDLEVERVKRVAVDTSDIDFDDNAPRKAASKIRFKSQSAAPSNAKYIPTPVVLPPYQNGEKFVSTRSCLFYLENITIVVLNLDSVGSSGGQVAYTLPLGSNGDTYGWDVNYASCPQNRTYKEMSFTVDYKPNGKYEAKSSDGNVRFGISDGFKLDLTFTYNSGFNLTKAVLTDGLNIKAGDSGSFVSKDISIPKNTAARNLYAANIRAYKGFNYACSATPAIMFPPVSESMHIYVGIVLNNFQVQDYGVNVNSNDPSAIPHFGGPVTDCVPTFNQGTWMGIITTLVLVSVLVFAFLMLNSVQTMDRFDDPKQKQIIINFKE